MEYSEVDSQFYSGNDCSFSSGIVDGHSVYTIYLRMEKDGEEATILHLRTNEAARIAALLCNAIWSQENTKEIAEEEEEEEEMGLQSQDIWKRKVLQRM